MGWCSGRGQALRGADRNCCFISGQWVSKTVAMALDRRLLEILAGPDDKGPLLYFPDEDSLYNPRLHRRYLVDDDIPNMLIDEAETVDEAEHERLMAKAESESIPFTFTL